MSKWEVQTYKLDQLGTVSRGKSRHRPRNEQSLYGGKYPFIQTGDVKSANFYITKYSQTYNEKGLSQSKLWDKGTLCITIAANIAETAILGIDACFPDSIVGFIPFENKSDVRYIKYCFDTYQKEMQAMSLGATQDNFSVEKMLKVKFIVPQLSTQQKIADILSAYDDLIENNNRRIELLEKAAENLYKEWFVRFRFPNYKKTKFQNGLPQGWEVVKVKNIVNRLPFGKLYKEKDLLSEGKVIVIDQSQKDYVGFHNNEPSHKASIDTPIIIFGDHSCKMQLMINDFSLSENVVPFISQNDIPIVFLYYLVNSLIETTEYKRHWTEFMSKKVLLPQKHLTVMFQEQVESNMVLINNLQIQNRNLIKQRDLLLPRLMSGKLEV